MLAKPLQRNTDSVLGGSHGSIFATLESLDLEVHVGVDAEEMVLDVGSPE